MSPGLQRIGVLGGAFDPPHLAHQALAQAAIEQLDLDELRVLPTGQAWHKTRPLSPAPHRLAMTHLAFDNLPKAVVDEREIQREGPTFTVDTLRELQAEHPSAQLFLVLGEDQAQAFNTWREFEVIPQLAIICVAARANFSGLPSTFKSENASSNSFWMPGFRVLTMPLMPLSATLIRARIADHQDITPLVSEPVARYIAHHHLFETT